MRERDRWMYVIRCEITIFLEQAITIAGHSERIVSNNKNTEQKQMKKDQRESEDRDKDVMKPKNKQKQQIFVIFFKNKQKI